jgi:DNA-binding transcriptional regulator YiaG
MIKDYRIEGAAASSTPSVERLCHHLRTPVVQTKATPKMSAKELSALRERMNLSRALSAKYLRTNIRTLENWEQGRARQRAGSIIDPHG